MQEHLGIENWLISQSAEKLTEEFDNRYADLIVKVPDCSPASHIGLSAGDYLVSVNNQPAIKINLLELLAQGSSSEVDYQFYSPAQHSYINVTTNRCPLGFIHEPSSLGIVERYQHEGFSGWDDFVMLWERRNWEYLLQISSESWALRTLSTILGKFSSEYGKSAEVLFKGAALYELGDERAGITEISWFIENESHKHESYTHAIAYFYAAKWCELLEDIDGCKDWLSDANRSNRGRLERISQEVYLKKFELPSEDTHWLGKQFPTMYSLETIEKTERHNLSDILASMSNEERLPVCVMPGYRGNGPYNESMLCYRTMYKYLSHRLRPMHVLTDELNKRSDRQWWYENEEKAIEQNIPLIILHDEERTVADSLENEFSPIFYLLDNNGKIVHEGKFYQPFDYWTSLGLDTEQSKAA